MTFVATTVPKPLSMATKCCLISSQQISCSHPSLSISYKPLKFQLSCKRASSLSLPFFFSLKRKEPLSRVCVATEEENNPVILEETEEDEPEILGNLDWDAAVHGENEESEGAFSYVEPPEKAKVYVGNLPYDVDSERLAMLFQQAGVVEMCEVIYNKVSEQSRGFGFVTMSTEEEAEKAVEMFNRYELNGRLLVVNIAAPRGSQPERSPRAQTIQSLEPSYRIYAGNLPWSVDSETLEQVFSEHGKVVSARVVMDRDSGRSRGFGFVDMSCESEMNDAIANLDGKSVDGRAIRVNAAEERPQRASRF